MSLPDHTSSSWRGAIAATLPVAAFVAIYFLYAPHVPLTYPDTEGYLAFDSSRSGGYPFFLAALKPFIRTLADYTIAQRLIYAAAVLMLGWELMRFPGSVWLAALGEAALLFNPTVNLFHFGLVTESLFLSLSVLFLAAAFAHLRNGGLGALGLASALAAASVTVRPTGLVLLGALAILLASAPGLTRRRVWARIFVAAVPAVAVLALESSYYHSYHPGARESLAPMHLLAKAGLVEIADPAAVIAAAPPHLQPLQKALEQDLAPVRQLIVGVPNEAARCRLTDSYEVGVQYAFAIPERTIATARDGSQALVDASLARLRHGIGGYLRLTADHLVCLWTLSKIDGPEKDAFAAYLDRQAQVIFEDEVRGLLLGAKSPSFQIALFRIALYSVAAILLATGIVLLWYLIRLRTPTPPLAAAGLCGLTMHGAMLFTAMTAIGTPRYTFGLWPFMALGIGLSALWIFRCRRNPA